jgi:hypothetical protein
VVPTAGEKPSYTETAGSSDFSWGRFHVNSTKQLPDLEDANIMPRIVSDSLLKYLGIIWLEGIHAWCHECLQWVPWGGRQTMATLFSRTVPTA